MIRKKITSLEYGVLIYFLTRAFFIGITFTSIIKVIKQDGWIIPLISIAIGILFIHLVNYIIDYEPDLYLPEKIDTLFNKFNSKIIIIIIILISIFYNILNYLNLNNFIHNQFLNKTPIFIIAIMFSITTYYILIKGFNTITKTSVILFFIGIIILLFTIANLLPTIEISNIKPMFHFNTSELIKSLSYFYTFNIAPLFIIALIPKNKIKNKNAKKIMILFYIISCLSLFSTIFLTLSTFGYELTALYEYPEFQVLKHISLIGLSSRIESILVIQWIFDLLIFNLLYIYFIIHNIKFITQKKDLNSNLLYAIYSIILIIIIVYLSKFNIYLNNYIIKYTYIIINSITIIILFVLFIKIKYYKN